MAGFFRQLPGTDRGLRQSMQRIQQSDQVTARRAHAGAGGNVGDGDDLDSILNVEILQRLACQRMLDILQTSDGLGFAVLNPNLVVKDWRIYVQVHVLVDRHRQDEAAMLAIERGQIGSAAAKSNSKWCSCNDHRNPLYRLRYSK